jgi:oligopeptide/dipeptide ABC transporter ATP-binding protein
MSTVPGPGPRAGPVPVSEAASETEAEAPLLEVVGLHVATGAGEILRGVDLAVPRGRVTGVVGESGSGKTTLGLAILGLLDQGRRISAGEVRLDGAVIGTASVDRTARLRGRRMSLIPQDPFRSFDPLRRIGPQVRRPLELHRGLGATEAGALVAALLARLGVREPESVMARYPHELSGGLLQRATIAAALSCEPELVVADEPTTALDALVQAQVIEAFLPLVRELGTSVVVITHDLRLLERMADHIGAMYAGRIVEFGPAPHLLTRPRHRYPEALLASSVRAVQPGERLPVIEGQPPSLPGSFPACAFAPRCGFADERCYREEPRYRWPAPEGYACHHPTGATR